MSEELLCITEKICKTPEAWGLWAGTALVTSLSMAFMHRLPRSRGRAPEFVSKMAGNVGGVLIALIFHTAYVLGVLGLLHMLPTVAPGLDTALFSQEGVIIVGYSSSFRNLTLCLASFWSVEGPSF